MLFADGYPVLVTNQASLEDLSRKMGASLAMNAFRPNVVLDGFAALGGRSDRTA